MFKYAIFTAKQDEFEVTFTSTLRSAHNTSSMGVYVEELTPPVDGMSPSEASQWLRDQLRIYGSLDEFVHQRTLEENPHEQTNLTEHLGQLTTPPGLQTRYND